MPSHSLQRVVLFGPESTGKTTLAQKLAAHYDTVWSPEYVRAYVDARSAALSASPLSLADVEAIAQGQLSNEEEAENEAAGKSRRLLFCDTDVLSTAIYSQHYFGACPPSVLRLAEERARRTALYLLLDIDIPWAPDAQRDRPHLRPQMHALFRNALEARGLPFAPVWGSFEQRMQRAVAAVDAMRHGASLR